MNELNTDVPQSARVYDYWLGGKDNFPADRAMAEAIARQVPSIRAQAVSYTHLTLPTKRIV